MSVLCRFLDWYYKSLTYQGDLNNLDVAMNLYRHFLFQSILDCLIRLLAYTLPMTVVLIVVVAAVVSCVSIQPLSVAFDIEKRNSSSFYDFIM